MTRKRATVFAVEVHDQVLELWRRQGLSGAFVVHVDFHCDLRGLLINRKAQLAYRIWDRFPALDEGNFLTHAVLDGVVSGIRWVHDDPGGREYDLNSVKYETDLTSVVARVLLAISQKPGIPIEYEVNNSRDWIPLRPEDVLDIDWDVFASREYSVDTIPERVRRFLALEFGNIPKYTYVCYSPGYSHATRELFLEFVRELGVRFSAEVIHVPRPERPSRPCMFYHRVPFSVVYAVARRAYHGLGLALRKRGIY